MSVKVPTKEKCENTCVCVCVLLTRNHIQISNFEKPLKTFLSEVTAPTYVWPQKNQHISNKSHSVLPSPISD